MLLCAELAAIALWAIALTRPYLDLDPRAMPAGREYGQDIMPHHVWTQLRECGWCALWFGSARGGSPAFIEPLNSSVLHPLVIVTTLGWGVLNGSKLALVGAFIMAGLAQWWLGSVLGVGRVARLWSAGMAVAGGHLASRMELGAFATLFATAACALVLPPLVTLCRTGSRRVAVVLGVILALAALSGRWYMHIGLVFGLPAVLLLLPWKSARLQRVASGFALAGALAVLLAAPFLVPFLHFLPEFAKDTASAFHGAQPLAYVPLNLVINDLAFYHTEVLGKLPYPSHYVLYIGWIPVLLALWAWREVRKGEAGLYIAFLTAFAGLVLWTASGAPLVWLAHHLPIARLAELFAGVRYPAFIAGLAVPPVLALAAVGIDRLLALRWSRLAIAVNLGENPGKQYLLDSRWLLAIPLGLALLDVRTFSSQWIGVQRLGPEVFDVLDALRTPDLQWVAEPFGEHVYTEAAVSRGLKLADDFRTWRWRDRALPEPVIEAHRAPSIPNMTPLFVVQGAYIHAAPPGREYAVVTHPDGGRTVCAAQGRGGNIDVSCDTPQPGVLTVKENNWSGWQAYLDWHPIPLRPERWLVVEVPAGSHTVQFRYRTWDVPVGLLLCLVGIALAFYQWRKGDVPAPHQPADGHSASSLPPPAASPRGNGSDK